MKRLWIGVAAIAAWCAPVGAAAEVVPACVGDSFVYEAPRGWVVTYTVPQFAGGWPNMFAESQAARQARHGAGMGAVQWEVLPNVDHVLAPSSGDPWKDKLSAKFNPVAYLAEITAEPSRVRVAVRDVTPALVRFWLLDPATGTYQRKELLVDPSQCGATSRLPSYGLAELCEGALFVSPISLPLVSSDRAAVYVYEGAQSGAQAFAGVRPGRSVLRDTVRPRFSIVSNVFGEGDQRCGDASGAALHAVGPAGREAFELDLCIGELWVSPSLASAGVVGVASHGDAVFTERDRAGTGYGIYAAKPGLATVWVHFEHPDSRPAVIRAHVSNCSVTPLTLLP